MTLPSINVANRDIGYGYNGMLTRVGNLVTFESWGAPTSNISDGSIINDAIPHGYRPVFNVRPTRQKADNADQWMTIQFMPTGQTRFYGNVRSGQAVMTYAVWVTNDDFPKT